MADETSDQIPPGPPCIVCKEPLKNLMYPEGNQPLGGLGFFRTYGHYGSSEFDPMDGSFLCINVCDICLEEAGKAGHVLLSQRQPTPSPVVSRWSPTRWTRVE